MKSIQNKNRVAKFETAASSCSLNMISQAKLRINISGQKTHDY
jgi:hypothetical protein